MFFSESYLFPIYSLISYTKSIVYTFNILAVSLEKLGLYFWQNIHDLSFRSFLAWPKKNQKIQGFLNFLTQNRSKKSLLDTDRFSNLNWQMFVLRQGKIFKHSWTTVKNFNAV